MRVTHENGRTDNRYTVAPEYFGGSKPAQVARFCGQYLGRADNDWKAWLICAEHKALRLVALEV